MDNIMVSVICNVYNQEQYVRQMLESVVTQETNFPFEVLVHDDASTDHTADIVREFENRYPGVVKPIYQKENQYSKYVSITKVYQFPRVSGKYIAVCEGDDYWTDKQKLQKQVDVLEKTPGVCACAHKVEKIREGQTIGYIAPKDHDCLIPAEEVILGGGMFIGTNSLLIHAETMMEMTPMLQMMSYDIVWQIQGSLPGGMLYLDDCMSAYRISVKGSWSQRMKSQPEKQIRHIERINTMFTELDKYTDGKYHDVISEKIHYNRFTALCLKKDLRTMLSGEYRDVRKKLSWKKKAVILRNMIAGR